MNPDEETPPPEPEKSAANSEGEAQPAAEFSEPPLEESPQEEALAEPPPEMAPEPAPIEAAAPEPEPEPELPAIEEEIFEPEPEPELVQAAEPEPEPAPEPEYVEAHEEGPAYEEPYAAEPEAHYDETHYDETQSESLFGTPDPTPEIPLPGEDRVDARRARDAQANLDLDLGRIKRRKRYGLLLTTISVFFVALVLAPVTWALVYLFFDPPSTITIMQRAAEGQNIQHAPVPITRMSPYIIRAVIASEDANFCTHHGFDVAAIQDAMEANADGGRMRGGSTISQQTAKNLFLWQQRSWVRKGLEVYFTSLIEFMWPKRRIMEAYLNAAEWGDGIFGIEAASRARFGVSAADLTPLQAARLAAVLPSPNRWSATSPGPYVRERSASIVARAQVIRNSHMAGCVLSLDAAPQ